MHKKQFPADLSHLYEMLDFIKQYGIDHKIPPHPLDQVILALEEVLVNVISYAYQDKKNGSIEIESLFLNTPKSIKIVIKDRGIPFNPLEHVPSSVPTPEEALQKTKEGGYGIFLFSGLMDKVTYERIGDENQLTLIKFFQD